VQFVEHGWLYVIRYMKQVGGPGTHGMIDKAAQQRCGLPW
jgi:hypothetical protein